MHEQRVNIAFTPCLRHLLNADSFAFTDSVVDGVLAVVAAIFGVVEAFDVDDGPFVVVDEGGVRLCFTLTEVHLGGNAFEQNC